MPFGVVLAGTPGLEDRLRKSGASYWDRGLKLGVGRLSSAEAEKVIAEPFKIAGISVGDGIAAKLASQADCYPCFLQVYGGAAWDAVARSDTRHLGPDQLAEALRQADVVRRQYYAQRQREFIDAGALHLARAVARGFREAGGYLTEPEMEVLLNREHGDGLDHAGRERFLRVRGFIWSPQPDLWEPGNPSLVDYMIARTPA